MRAPLTLPLLVACWSFTPIVRAQCLLAHYPLDGTAADVGPNGLDGTAYNSTPTVDRMGMPNGAIHFNGVNTRIDLPSDFDVPERTWAFWCKADVIDAGVSNVYDDDHPALENGQTEVWFTLHDGVPSIGLLMGSSNTDHFETVQEGQWYHVAQVRSSTEVRYYLNGCLVFTSTDVSNVHSDTGEPFAALGVNRAHNSRFFNGDLDDLQIFDCALDAAQIDSLADHRCSACAPMVHYLLDGDALDAGPDGLDGVGYSITATEDRMGTPGGAVHFNGVDAQIDLPSAFDVPERTWAFWCKADVINEGIGNVYDDDNNDLVYGQTEVWFTLHDGVPSIGLLMGTSNTDHFETVQQDRWYHVAQVRSATEVRYYLDGCLVFTSPDVSNGHAASGEPYAALGVDRAHNGRFFNGDLDDLRIYACALSTEDIQALAGRSCSTAIGDAERPGVLELRAQGEGRYVLDPFAGGRYTLEVFDALGRPVLVQQAQGLSTLDLSGRAGAAYTVRASSGDRWATCRVVVVH